MENIKAELATIADRMRAIPFETPVSYTEYSDLRARRSALLAMLAGTRYGVAQ